MTSYGERYTPEEEAEIVKMYGEGWSTNQIARIMRDGGSVGGIRKVLIRHHVMLSRNRPHKFTWDESDDQAKRRRQQEAHNAD